MYRALPAFCALVLAGLPAWALNAGLGAPPPTVDRQTPQAAFQGFLDASHSGDYKRAAHYLDLDFVPRAEQAERGPQLARRLKFVLDRKLPVDLSTLSKAPEGDGGGRALRPASAPSRWMARWCPSALQRVVGGEDGALVWVFTEATVKQVDKLFDAYGPHPGGDAAGGLLRAPGVGAGAVAVAGAAGDAGGGVGAGGAAGAGVARGGDADGEVDPTWGGTTRW